MSTAFCWAADHISQQKTGVGRDDEASVLLARTRTDGVRNIQNICSKGGSVPSLRRGQCMLHCTELRSHVCGCELPALFCKANQSLFQLKGKKQPELLLRNYSQKISAILRIDPKYTIARPKSWNFIRIPTADTLPVETSFVESILSTYQQW